jgi:outer membrane lipoprotein SlyB
MKKVLSFIIGAVAGGIAGYILTKNPIGGGVGGLFGGMILSALVGKLGGSAIEKEEKALSGKGRSVGKAIFWWFVLLLVGVGVLIFIGVIKR